MPDTDRYVDERAAPSSAPRSALHKFGHPRKQPAPNVLACSREVAAHSHDVLYGTIIGATGGTPARYQ